MTSFHAVLGWDSGIGFAFQIQVQEFKPLPAQVKTAIGVLTAAHPNRSASTWELLRSVLTDGP